MERRSCAQNWNIMAFLPSSFLHSFPSQSKRKKQNNKQNKTPQAHTYRGVRVKSHLFLRCWNRVCTSVSLSSQDGVINKYKDEFRLGNKHVTTRGIFFAIFHSFLPQVYSFQHNFVWEPGAFCFLAGVNWPWCSHLFPSLRMIQNTIKLQLIHVLLKTFMIILPGITVLYIWPVLIQYYVT